MDAVLLESKLAFRPDSRQPFLELARLSLVSVRLRRRLIELCRDRERLRTGDRERLCERLLDRTIEQRLFELAQLRMELFVEVGLGVFLPREFSPE